MTQEVINVEEEEEETAAKHTAVDLTSASATQDLKGLKLDGRKCSVCHEKTTSNETEYLLSH